MDLVFQRFSDNRKSTIGLMFKKIQVGTEQRLHFVAYGLEDEHRDVKVKAETRIPAGFYELGLRQDETPKTIQYRTKYPWFKKHIEILKVPGFTGVYIHIGNTDADTEGCLLLGDNADNNQIGDGSISNSTNAFKRFYSEVYPLLEAGKKVCLTIRDEDYLLK